ncbi:nucleoside-diphosphate-sugar epimerase family protein [Aspergillus affinis]|uniref:nucleoside-diphosphate-sugar epimerase family protein n=1 Tax=Aspergillus affinis TaxID=1070780 RepID=UPI0022FED723|nr:nucleoside-diphosphate-sugar epimerase family protein [Aspergillus affinis]KAI9039640.1 nucleoside-diphosphate-sugar epimerase family protein [Aspergillus affinis]
MHDYENHFLRSLIGIRKILAVTRNAKSSSVLNLAQTSPNVTLIEGNLDDPAGIFKAVKAQTSTPVWGVFSVQDRPPILKKDDERRQGIALIDESIKQGVKFFVYSSVDRGGEKRSFPNPTPVPHFIYKHEIEQYLIKRSKDADAKMAWTVAFLENFTPDYFGKVFTTAWQMSLKGKPLQMVATSDIGFFAGEAFVRPDEFEGKALSLAGDELTFEQMAAVFERLTGRKVPTTFQLPVWAMMAAVKDLGVMFEWFHDEGYGADLAEMRRINPDLKDFGKWLVEESQFDTLQGRS